MNHLEMDACAEIAFSKKPFAMGKGVPPQADQTGTRNKRRHLRVWRVKVIDTYHQTLYYPQWRYRWIPLWFTSRRPNPEGRLESCFEDSAAAFQFIRKQRRA